MSKGKTFLAGFFVAMVALTAGIYSGLQRQDSHRPAPPALTAERIDKLFASTLNDADGKAQAFAQWRGKTLVVNFWATWCPPCREEMPDFSRLQGKYVTNGVQFVGIALDTKENVQDFARQFPVIYPLLIGGAEGAQLTRELGNPRLALPYTLIISPAGEVRFAGLGGLSGNELEALLQKSTAR